MDRALWTIILFVIVLVVVVSVFVWNIVIVGRSSITTEQNLTLIQKSVIDGLHADAQDNPMFAAIKTQQALSRLETLSALFGGNGPLQKTTHVDVDKLHALLTQQMRDIMDCLPETKKHPLLSVDDVD